jgi:hypothetical protein
MVIRKQARGLDESQVKRTFDSLRSRISLAPLPGHVEFHTKAVEGTKIWMSVGQTGSQVKCQLLGGVRKTSWWPTVTLISAMHSDSSSAIFSILSSAVFVNQGLIQKGISSGYEKRFAEFGKVLESVV